MKSKNKEISRREFLKAAGITGLSSVIALSSGISGSVFAQEQQKGTPTPELPAPIKVPTRIFGKTAVPVSILSLGGIFDITANQIVLKKALDWGVTYWDTANSYVGGNSETGIGNFFERFPDTRKQVFLVTKSGSGNPTGMTEHLNLSLKRMKTDYIDLFFVHGVKNISELTPGVKQWAEQQKKDKKIKFFGFSTHNNMATLLADAAKLGWIDGIMMTYNYRLMHEDAMKAGVEACHKANIGLTAMKTQGGGPVKTDSEAELALAGQFVNKGYSPQQAKLKSVWANDAISAICSQMANLTILAANVAAAVDKTQIELSSFEALKTYADATCSGYCEGCMRCESEMQSETHIADVMRYMMYYRSYGEPERARDLFAELPSEIRIRMASLDYSAAERVCPHRIAIGEVMRDAVRMLG